MTRKLLRKMRKQTASYLGTSKATSECEYEPREHRGTEIEGEREKPKLTKWRKACRVRKYCALFRQDQNE